MGRFSQSESQNQPCHQDCQFSQSSQLPRLRDLPESKCSQRSHSQLYLFKAKQQLPDSPQLADLPSTLLAPPRLNSSQLLLPPLQPLLLMTQANLLLQNFYCNSNSQQAVKTFSLIIV